MYGDILNDADKDEYLERVAEKRQELEATGYEGDITAESHRRVDIEDAVIEVFKKDLYSDDKYLWAYPPAICGRLRDTHPKLKATMDDVAEACDCCANKRILAYRTYEEGKKYVFNTHHRTV